MPSEYSTQTGVSADKTSRDPPRIVWIFSGVLSVHGAALGAEVGTAGVGGAGGAGEAVGAGDQTEGDQAAGTGAGSCAAPHEAQVEDLAPAWKSVLPDFDFNLRNPCPADDDPTTASARKSQLRMLWATIITGSVLNRSGLCETCRPESIVSFVPPELALRFSSLTYSN